MRRAASHREVWKISFVALTLSGPMLTLGGLWGTPYLIVAYDLSRPYAAFLMSLLLFGWAVGAPAAGWLSDRLGRRKPILIAGSVILCLMLFLLIFIPHLPLAAAVVIIIIIGLSGGSMATCFALVRDVLPDRITGAATGIVNALRWRPELCSSLLLDCFWTSRLQTTQRPILKRFSGRLLCHSCHSFCWLAGGLSSSRKVMISISLSVSCAMLWPANRHRGEQGE